MIHHRWVAVLLGLVFLAASVDFACAYGLARGHTGFVGTPTPPVVGIVPGSFSVGTCNPCTDSNGTTDNYFYGNPWPPQHQPAQMGSSSSPYFNSDAIAEWSGAQLQTITTTQPVCFVGSSPAAAASGSNLDYGGDHAVFAVDGGDGLNGQPANQVTVNSPVGDPQNYPIVSITGNGTSAIATLGVQFAFHAQLNVTRVSTSVTWSGTAETVTFNDTSAWPAGTLVSITGATPSNLNVSNAVVTVGAAGSFTFTNPALTGSGTASVNGSSNIVEGHGEHVMITGAGSFSGSYQLTDSQPATEANPNATITFPSSFSGTVSGGTLNDTEPMYWCVPINPALFADGLHELRAVFYPKIGWPRLMQGPHFVSNSPPSNTGIDETNGSGIFTIPAHGWSKDPVTIESVGSPGANPCLVPKGFGNTTAAQNYSMAVMLNPGMPTSQQPPLPLRGYQFGLFNSFANSYVNMAGCTDDQIVITDLHGTQNRDGDQIWMPYGGTPGNSLLRGTRNNHAYWFFTNSNGTAYNPTITIDGTATPGVQGCGISPATACASIDDAIANSVLNPNDPTSTSPQNTCTLNATNGSAILTTPASGAGACDVIVGSVLFNALNIGSNLKRGMHSALPYYVTGIAGQATGTVLAAGESFVLSSIPVASPTSSATYACPSSTTFMCANATATILSVSQGGDGATLVLNGTPSAPQYYSFGTQPISTTAANFNQWFTIKGQTETGAIINQSGHIDRLVDALNNIWTITAATWTGTQLSLSFTAAAGLTPTSPVTVSGLQCPVGVNCGTPNGAGLTLASASTTSAVVDNTGLLSAGTFPINNSNAGPNYSLEHLQNLSVCGVDPTFNISPLCSNTEPNPYINISLGVSPLGNIPRTMLWLDNVSQYGIGDWIENPGTGPGMPFNSASTDAFGQGAWWTNSETWHSGPLNAAGLGSFGSVENVLLSGNLGQLSEVGLIRNFSDDGLAQGYYSQFDCADYIAGGNPGSLCNAATGLLTAPGPIFPVTVINPQIATAGFNFFTAPAPGGGTYATRFGWPNVGGWFINASAGNTVNIPGAGGMSITGSDFIQACFDVTGKAPNCPAGQAIFANCQSAGVSCIQLETGGAATFTNTNALAVEDTNIHVDVFFQKDASSGSSTGVTSDVVTVNLTVPDRPCAAATVAAPAAVSCNASEGIISQAPTVADWALLNSTMVQLGSGSAVIHVSGSFENWYVKNSNWGSCCSEISGLDAAIGTSGPLFPPGGGEFGNGKIDGIVWDNSTCAPETDFAGGNPVYYAYWAKTILGDGSKVTMSLADQGISIPAGTPITTLSDAPNDFHTQIFLNSVNNPAYPISGITSSGGTATAAWLPLGPQLGSNAFTNTPTSPVTLPAGNSITVSGITMPYTPTAASWSGTVETITFTPADTIQVGASVTPGGLACTSCGGSPNPNLAGTVTASSPGSITYTNATLTAGAGSMTLTSPTLAQTTLGYNGNFTTTAGASGTLGYLASPTVTSTSAGTVTINGYNSNNNASITWSGTVETIHSLPGTTLTAGTAVAVTLAVPTNLNVTQNVLASPAPAPGVFSINNTALSGSGTATAAGVMNENFGAVNGANVAAINTSGTTTAGQVQFPSAMNEPLMIMPQNGASAQFVPNQIAGFVIVPGPVGTGEDSTSYVNPAAVNACTNGAAVGSPAPFLLDMPSPYPGGLN
jgi:hypothetical protein